jgi:hypothetical protein
MTLLPSIEPSKSDTPAMFCLIEYATRKEAEACVLGSKGKKLGFAFVATE